MSAGGEHGASGREQQLEQERQIAALKQLQADAGLVPKANVDAKLDWMYEDPRAAKTEESTEEFLLGKKKPDAEGKEDVERVKQLSASQGGAVGSLFLSSLTTTTEDTLRKLREDPLLVIKQAEMQQRQNVFKNPLLREQLLSKDDKDKRKKAKKEKKKQKKRGRGSSSESDADRRKHRKREAKDEAHPSVKREREEGDRREGKAGFSMPEGKYRLEDTLDLMQNDPDIRRARAKWDSERERRREEHFSLEIERENRGRRGGGREREREDELDDDDDIFRRVSKRRAKTYAADDRYATCVSVW